MIFSVVCLFTRCLIRCRVVRGRRGVSKDAGLPRHGGLPCPPGIGLIRLSIAETAQLTPLAGQYAAGQITRARLGFTLRRSLRRRLHQAIARWHHYSARLPTPATG